MKTSLFLCFKDLTISRTSACPLGSNPVVGSSKRTISGSDNRAAAILILCFIPFENLPTFLSIHSSILTSDTTASILFERSARGMPRKSAIIESASRGVKDG